MTFEDFLLDARSIVTLASFVSFIGIVLWAYSARRRETFEHAASLPLFDDEVQGIDPERRHG